MSHALPLLAQDALNPGFLAMGALIFLVLAVVLLIVFRLRKPRP